MFCERTFRFAVWLPFLLVASQFLMSYTQVQQDDCPDCLKPGSNGTCHTSDNGTKCDCYDGYIGDNCTQCEDDFYQYNTTEPCEPCECNAIGAVNNTCDRFGSCQCLDGVEGSKCDTCKDGYYGLTDKGCTKCDCNQHATLCHKVTGVCQNCSNNTVGDDCNECKTGYYRENDTMLEERCEECPCLEHSSTQTCHYEDDINNGTGGIRCDPCQEGYTGNYCDTCDNNYYMTNLTLQTCELCNCSDHINISVVGNCDPLNGKCLKCIYNTFGDHCEECLPGYDGDPDYGNCTAPDYTPNEPTTANSHLSIITIMVVIVLVIIGAIAGGVFYIYRRKHYRKTPLPFWTIELRKDDSMSFNDYHNLDASLIDDVMIAPRGQLRLGDTSNYDTINT